jgi:hypothetical protein
MSPEFNFCKLVLCHRNSDNFRNCEMTKKPQCHHCDTKFEYHAPEFIRAATVTCEEYNTWLTSRTKSVRNRRKPSESNIDGDNVTQHPNLNTAHDRIKERIHEAVKHQGDKDFYTGLPIDWKLIKDKQPSGRGRSIHNSKGEWPSVDHYFGTKKPDYRICTKAINEAKGSMSHDDFIKLCKNVVDHANSDQSRKTLRQKNNRDVVELGN